MRLPRLLACSVALAMGTLAICGLRAARYLTAPEMRELTAFYRTPTGGKLLTVLPKIMTEAFSAVLPRMPTLAADTQEAFLKLLHERGHLK